MTDWHFRPKRRGETIREPIHGEFFASDSISNPGTALVREGIQNALDAASGEEAVLVRIYLSDENQDVKAVDAEPYFATAWPHFDAPGNGLKEKTDVSPKKPCRFIAFEDFYTTGLTGNPEEAFRAQDGTANHFYHFFRAEGQTDKGDSDRGSWGVGKHVFLRSSRISSVFGLTIREDDKRRMLMGKSVLRSHHVEDRYFQDGYFGVRDGSEDDFVKPSEDSNYIDRFAELFDLQRGTLPGLSLVVPWPDLDIDDGAIKEAVVRDYFYPILTGRLEVIVETPSVKVWLDRNSLPDELDTLTEKTSAKLRPLIELAVWSQNSEATNHIVLAAPAGDRAMKWSGDLVSEKQLSMLREKLNSGENIAVEVPVNIRKRDAEPQCSSFRIYMVSDTSEHSETPVYIREGIIISEIKSPKLRSVRAIVVADDTPLAAFLRKSENPSHTLWEHSRLKEDYVFGYKTDLEFVTRSVHELVRLITAADKEEDRRILADFFSIPASSEDETVTSPGKKSSPGKGPVSSPPVITADPPIRRIQIQKSDGGFSVVPGITEVDSLYNLNISVGYDVRRGDALKKYDTADFDVSKEPIRLSYENMEISRQEGNRITARVKDPEFALHVTGFDPNRQLFVKAEMREAK